MLIEKDCFMGRVKNERNLDDGLKCGSINFASEKLTGAALLLSFLLQRHSTIHNLFPRKTLVSFFGIFMNIVFVSRRFVTSRFHPSACPHQTHPPHNFSDSIKKHVNNKNLSILFSSFPTSTSLSIWSIKSFLSRKAKSRKKTDGEGTFRSKTKSDCVCDVKICKNVAEGGVVGRIHMCLL